MSELTKKNHFTDNGISDRSGENFQNHLFQNIDFEQRNEPISFFRGDFRGSRMVGMNFYRNNFDRADIINATISNTKFKECKWGTDFINTSFSRTDFLGNMMDTCTIHNCLYERCNFTNERIINTSNRDSTFKNCSFNDCLFEMNSYNDVHFVNCKFGQIDLSNMGAYDLTFDNCRFRKLTVDPDYFGSYLFKNTSLEDITYAYRGNGFKISGNFNNDLESLAIFYLEKERYYEAFNTMLLFRHFLKADLSIVNYFKKIIDLILETSNFLIRQDQLSRIVNILIFYADSPILSSDDIFYFIGYLKELNLNFASLKDKLTFTNNIDLLAKTIEAYTFDIRMLSPALEFKPLYAEIQIDEEDLDDFNMQFNAFFETLMRENGETGSPGYRIVGTRKGSLIIEIVAWAVGIYVLATILKSSFAKFLEIRMEYQLFQKARKVIESEIITLNDLSSKAPQLRKVMSQPSDEIFKKAKPLSQLMKQFHIFPNALPERKKIG